MFTKTDIEKYFNAEKGTGLLFTIVGIAAVIAAINLFIFLKPNFYKGAATSLLLIGLLVGIIGFTVYKKSDTDRIRNVYAYDMNPGEIKNKELLRIQKVVQDFNIYFSVEVALLITGIFLFVYFKNNEAQQFWKGFGLSLFIMSSLVILADYFAAQRAAIYLKGLLDFVNNNHT